MLFTFLFNAVYSSSSGCTSQLQESLEFVKVRLFLRQVEVYFSKQQSHYQKIINTILEWEEDKLPPSAMV